MIERKIVIGAALLPSAAMITACGDSSAPQQAQKPNVIIILADDLGYGDVSAYGATTVATPNIDRLGNEGVSFTNGYATSATSTPSRYALFTGSYPWKNPNAKILPGDAPLLISVDQFTMPKMMQKAGYATAAIGKWHLGMGLGNVNWNETVTPGANQIGFDYSCLIAATNDRVPTVYVENGDVVGLEKSDPIEVNYETNYGDQPTGLKNPELLKMHWAHGHNGTIVNGIPRIGFMKGGEKAKWVDEDMADYFMGKIKTFISDNKKNPFFLYYGLHQPHVPRTPNGRFVGKTTMGPRGDAIMEADWCVGELMATLEKEGLLENTMVIFSSDNGPVMNDGYKDGAWEKLGDHDPMGGLRGGKYSLFDAGTHVPFFVYWKGKIQPIKSDALISQLDIVASVAELIDEKIPAGLDSENHLDTFLGKSTKGRKSHVSEASGRMAYRKGDYFLIPPFKGSERNETGNELGNVDKFSLYNVTKEPSQMSEISAQEPEIAAQLKREFLTLTDGYYDPNMAEEVLK